MRSLSLPLLATALAFALLIPTCVSTAQEMPEIIVTPSSVGEVQFPHALHYDDMGFECTECHHEIDAAELVMPHEDYFDDFWIDCRICHVPGTEASTSMSCSSCHTKPAADIADETLSSKVVIHQSCWRCHEVATGADASQACGICHQESSASN
jgi:hypothetical protein